MALRPRWTAPLRPGALAGSAVVHVGLALGLVGWWALPERVARGTQAPIRIEPSAPAPEVVAESLEPRVERLEQPPESVEAFLAETRPVDLDAEPLFPEEPLEPLAEPRWEGPLETAPPDLLLAARPRRAEASAEEPTAEPADEPASEQAQAAAPESAATAAEPRGLEVESSAPVEVPGACEPPSYPEALSRRGLEARVRLAITVAPDGHVNGVEILEWSGHRPLVERAAQAVLTWRYTPGRRDGEAVEWVVEKTIVFDPGSNR